MSQSESANAYTEVYEILQQLDEKEYNKIPKELIKMLEKNRNLNYIYKVNENQNLMEQPMLKETESILLHIFSDYLVIPLQKGKANGDQSGDRVIIKEQSRENFKINFFKDKVNVTTEKDNTRINSESVVEISIQSFLKEIFKKILSKIKNCFRHKK